MKRRTEIRPWMVVLLVVAALIILDDRPTIWDKTKDVAERVLFGGLLSD